MHLLFERSITQIMKNFKSLYGFGDSVSKLETFVWILSHISRPITWFLFTLKASYLVKWSISTWSFMWWCQFIDWLKFETCPSSLLNFGTAYFRRSRVWSRGLLSRTAAGNRAYIPDWNKNPFYVVRWYISLAWDAKVLTRVITCSKLRTPKKCLPKIVVSQWAQAQCCLCFVCFFTPLDLLGTS